MLISASPQASGSSILQLRVVVVPERSCWIALPAGLCDQLYSSNCMPPLIFQLTAGARCLKFCLSVFVSSAF